MQPKAVQTEVVQQKSNEEQKRASEFCPHYPEAY